jgi:hypothetical protein
MALPRCLCKWVEICGIDSKQDRLRQWDLAPRKGVISTRSLPAVSKTSRRHHLAWAGDLPPTEAMRTTENACLLRIISRPGLERLPTLHLSTLPLPGQHRAMATSNLGLKGAIGVQ